MPRGAARREEHDRSLIFTQAVAAALATLIVAALGYLAAVISQHTKALQAAAVITAAAAATASVRSARATDRAGGSATPRAYPLWNQNDDPLPTGQLPTAGYQECGEECCAEVIFVQHGVEVEADALRAQYRGAQGAALTTAGDLVKILAHNNVAAIALSPAGGDLAALLSAASAEGRACIVLGSWLAPSVLHWVLVTTADAHAVGYNDPWGGVRRSATWDVVRAKYAGSLVEVTRRPDEGAPAQNGPQT